MTENLDFFEKMKALNLSELDSYMVLFEQLYKSAINTENPPLEPVPVLEAMLKKAKLIEYLSREGFSAKNLHTEFLIHYSQINNNRVPS